MRTTSIIALICLLHIGLSAQEKKPSWWKDRVQISGFVKYMNTASIANPDSIITDNLIHNRLRLKVNITNKLTSVVEMRNRVFYGEATSLNPNLGSLLDDDGGQVDLSLVPLNKKDLVFHSILDRAYLKYSAEKWELRLGRQRINWGVNLAWNPNDLFNAYSLIDFDYQERPGADAIRFQYFTSDLSSVEFAAQPGRSLDSSVIAAMWKFNKWQYDFQLIAANYYKDFTIGAAWAGNIKTAGFKTELSYFHPKNNFKDISGSLSLSTSIDYSFKNGLYLNGSLLLNTSGISEPLNASSLFQTFIGDITAKSLMPSKLTYFGQISGAFTPKLTGSLSLFYMQGINMLLCMPSVVYGIEDNWELMLTAQAAFGSLNNTFQSMGSGVYLRLMYSF
jgi:hypothetical protein